MIILNDQETVERFQMLLAAESRIARAEEACRDLGLKEEAKKLGDMRAKIVAELEPLRDKAYALLGKTPPRPR